MASIYAVRQAALRSMRDLHGAPVTAEELLDISQEAALRTGERETALAAVRGLKEMGYLEAVPGFAGMYLRITRRGLEQLLPEFPQEAYIWGPGAV